MRIFYTYMRIFICLSVNADVQIKPLYNQICNNQKQYSRVNLHQNMAQTEKNFKKWFCNGELCDVKNNIQKVYRNPPIRKPNNFGVKKVFFF